MIEKIKIALEKAKECGVTIYDPNAKEGIFTRGLLDNMNAWQIFYSRPTLTRFVIFDGWETQDYRNLPSRSQIFKLADYESVWPNFPRGRDDKYMALGITDKGIESLFKDNCLTNTDVLVGTF